jgi:DNA polymerase-3 subunit delta
MSDANKIIADLKQKKYAPVYFLCGTETYFIDQVSDFIENNVLSDSEKGFNQMVIYGKETSMIEVLENAKRYPMMADYQVIIVKEAQHLVKQLDVLKQYLIKPQPTTILVFAYKYKTPDGRSAMAKLLKKHTVYLESKPLYDNQIPAFVNNQLKEVGYQIHPTATRMLVEYLGTDLGKVKSEITKLTIVHPKEDIITPQVIENHIGISKDYNIFELTKAIGARDVVKAHRIINYFAENPKENPMVVITAQLHRFFVQLLHIHCLKNKNDPKEAAKAAQVSTYFVQELITAAHNYPTKYCSRAIKLIRDLDAKSKGVGTYQVNDASLLKETLVNIMSS